MTANQLLKELAAFGSDQTKRIYLSHGAKEPLFGVKIGDLKKLQKRAGILYETALELWDSGNADARYLAALCADENRMTKRDLRKWAREADWPMLSEYAVAQLISKIQKLGRTGKKRKRGRC